MNADREQARSSKLLRRNFNTQAVTLVVGILIIVLTLYCNNWVIKGQTALSNLEQAEAALNNIDRTDLVLTYDLCNQNNEPIQASDLARIVRVGDTIQKFDALLGYAHDSAAILLNATNWLSWSEDSTNEEHNNTNEEHNNTGTDPESQIQWDHADICGGFSDDSLVENVRLWRNSLRGFAQEFETSRGEFLFTGQGHGANEVLVQRLRAKMYEITRWWLPVLNGALGAIIFCLTRMIKDRVTAPKLGEVLLRMVFGGFIGILVSTLLLPGGAITGQYVNTAPGVSLLAFIFGFSLDSFIQLLERLNRMVMDSTRPKDPKP